MLFQRIVVIQTREDERRPSSLEESFVEAPLVFRFPTRYDRCTQEEQAAVRETTHNTSGLRMHMLG
jgi:hypothetical protein